MSITTPTCRASIRCFTLTATLLASCLTWAQTGPATAATSAPDPTRPYARQPVEQRTERIHIEDNSAVIDEVRIGGQTKSIDVQPKGGMPAYQVAPTSGERSWKVLGF